MRRILQANHLLHCDYTNLIISQGNCTSIYTKYKKINTQPPNKNLTLERTKDNNRTTSRIGQFLRYISRVVMCENLNIASYCHTSHVTLKKNFEPLIKLDNDQKRTTNSSTPKSCKNAK